MAVKPVITDELTALASSGRFATVLCRLSRARMTGVVYVEREEGGAVVTLRDGVPVFIEDLGGGDPLGDAMLAQEVITPSQYAMIMEHTLSDLTGSEDLAFAVKAVELGVLSQAQVDAELQRRVRGQMIQALAWDSARIEIDDDPEGVTCPEYPQSIGSLLYMAVRTFFDEERVQALLGEHRELYVRLLRARAEIADDLGLDDAERELLGALEPPSSVRSAVERLAADSLEAHQLVAMLVLAEHAEYAGRPFSAPIEMPSQHRTRNPSGIGRYVTTEALPEERLGPIVRPRPVTPTRVAPPVATEGDYAFNAPPQQSVPPRPPSAPQRPPSASQPRRPSGPQPRVAIPSATRSTSRAQQPVAPTPPAAPPPERRTEGARPRRLGAALKRLGKELEERRAHTQQLVPESEPPTGSPARPAAAPAAGVAAAAAAAPGASAADQHAVRELIRRRRAAVSQANAGGEKKPQAVNPAELMRSAQDALRDQQFGRAQELLARACEAEPSNDVYKMYRLWAAFRASAIQEADLTAFKALVREKLNDDLHKAFAYYAMGHIMLADKKDDNAEKFFRKAMEFDKTNKDAERHVRLLQLRNKTAATDTANSKIFGIEIGKKS